MTLDLGALDTIVDRLLNVTEDAYWDGEFPINRDNYRGAIVAALTGVPADTTTDTGPF